MAGLRFSKLQAFIRGIIKRRMDRNSLDNSLTIGYMSGVLARIVRGLSSLFFMACVLPVHAEDRTGVVGAELSLRPNSHNIYPKGLADPHWEKVLVLLEPENGVDLVDKSPYGDGLVSVNGTAKVMNSPDGIGSISFTNNPNRSEPEDSYVRLKDSLGALVQRNPGTFEAWFKMKDPIGWPVNPLFDLTVNTGCGEHYVSERGVVLSCGAVGSVVPESVAALYRDDKWHHYAIASDGTTLRFFVDGKLRASEPLGTLFRQAYGSPTRLWLGMSIAWRQGSVRNSVC